MARRVIQRVAMARMRCDARCRDASSRALCARARLPTRMRVAMSSKAAERIRWRELLFSLR